MATAVSSTEEIVLQDDPATTVVLRALNIKALRKFMQKMNEFTELETEDEMAVVDILVDAAVICIEKQVGEKANDPEWKEEAFDMPTVYKIIEVCGGIKLNDPNLLRAVTETAQVQ